jgi:hypothetical protein
MQSKRGKLASSEKSQSVEDTDKMDALTALLYEICETNKSQLPKTIATYLAENGQHLVHKKDSTGNRLIHNVCMALEDSD